MAISGDAIDGDQLLEIIAMTTTPGKPSSPENPARNLP